LFYSTCPKRHADYHNDTFVDINAIEIRPHNDTFVDINLTR